MIININKKTIKYILKNINFNNSIGIKIFIKNYGCMGKILKIKILKNIIKNKIILKYYKILFFLNPKYCIYINGINILYYKKKISKEIIIKNNKIKEICKCGKSFKIL
ncbi:putative FeS cluster assembly scaffold IscA [Candidatus Zinderia insecticola CARI]|uniref:Putative FeS cluster assembly scaffold IscA n=1 Tax=Zinderia insecticola (strain CARI) TaxID=871271 RepID=E0TIS6_ZINIC|nr:putative FeS cluster assembly scaffold IscA [Candidatus Zinderia insecticola CARI]